MTQPPEEAPRTLDDVVAALQSPARAEELEAETALVQAMAEVIAVDHQEPRSMPPRARPLKLGLLAGAAVLSVAGVAAAATGALPARKADPPAASHLEQVPPRRQPTTTVDPTTTTVALDPTTTVATTTAPTSSTIPDLEPPRPGEVPLVPGSSPGRTPVTAPPCPPDVRNHGEYVSQVARDVPPGPEHGAIVAAAAQSDCGKQGSDDDQVGDEQTRQGPPAPVSVRSGSDGRDHTPGVPPSRPAQARGGDRDGPHGDQGKAGNAGGQGRGDRRGGPHSGRGRG